MGVIAVTDIDYGQIFGPFPSYLISTDPAYVIGLLTSDKHPDGVVIKVDTNDRRERMGPVDWLPYVSSARDEEEQNMEAYPKEGCIFYRTLRIVKAGEELLVWYSKDFTQILAVPELQTNSKRDDEQFICTHCGEMFEFPFPLRAHLKFKCAFASEEKLFIQRNTQQLSPSSFRVDRLHIKHNDKNSITGRHNENNMELKNNKVAVYSENNNRKSPNSNNIYSNNISSFVQNHRKRPSTADEDDNKDISPPPKEKIANIEKTTKKDSFNSYSIENLSKSHVPQPKVEDKLSPTLVQHEHNNLAIQVENISAFRKVEKSPHTFSDSRVSPVSSISSLNSSPPLNPVTPPKVVQKVAPPPAPSSNLSTPHTNSTLFGQSATAMHSFHNETSRPSMHPSTSSFIQPTKRPIKSMIPASSCDSSMATPSLMSMYMPRLPMLPQQAPLRMPPSATLMGQSSSISTSSSAIPIPVPHSAFPDQIPPGLLEMCRATIPTVGPLTESFTANIRNGNIQATLSKQALFADRHISSLGFLKSTNPMVEKLLQTTNPTLLSSPINAMNLSQNWCAKCNATFRMTSDLVYHMRSHHKREFDPMKKKREEKLRCNICNETFRERHHLTRHMSSHA